MTGSLFRRVVLLALGLIAVTVLTLDSVLSADLARGAPGVEVRWHVLAISAGSALLALGVGYLISRSLSKRIRALKQVAERMLEKGPRETASANYSPGDLESLETLLPIVKSEVRGLLDRLQFESARRDAILSGMAEGVLALDQDLRVIFSNRALSRTIGPAAGIQGLTLLELIRDTGLHSLLDSVLASGEGRSLRLKLTGGSLRVFEVQATPLDMPSGRGAIVIFHDMTELERLEQVRKDFIANVSHEFRTPLAGIIGYAETLLDGALNDMENRRRFLEIIRANALRLTNIAADLLVLSDLESERDAPEPEEIRLEGVVDSVLATVESEARLRSVRLVRGEVADAIVLGSRLRVEQVLLNLIANAIKFNRPEGEVRVSAVKTADGQVAIVVADTGVGIPSQDLPRVFERFYRVDKARSKDVGGTGLGLSIVKHAVERMNGTITVESQLGEGSIFRISLPSRKITATER